MTERQRRALLNQHPEVVSWMDFFDKRNSRRRIDTVKSRDVVYDVVV
jgi:hypothetical protein